MHGSALCHHISLQSADRRNRTLHGRVEGSGRAFSRSSRSAGQSGIPSASRRSHERFRQGQSSQQHLVLAVSGGEVLTARIRSLNDALRMRGPASATPDVWLFTQGVMALGVEKVRAVIEAVRSFQNFSVDNDPHREHDFGSFELAGERVFWKIDYYNPSFDGGSPDPSDETATRRVLTVMLALEY
jgi:hypothetical protein